MHNKIDQKTMAKSEDFAYVIKAELDYVEQKLDLAKVDKTDQRLTDARTPLAHDHNSVYYTKTEEDAAHDAKLNKAGTKQVDGETTFSGIVRFLGEIIQVASGQTITTEKIYSKQTMVHLNTEQATGDVVASGASGAIVHRGTGQKYFYGLIEGVKTLFKIGKVTIDANDNITDASGLQAVYTREDSPITSGIPIWDGTANRADHSKLMYDNKQIKYKGDDGQFRSITGSGGNGVNFIDETAYWTASSVNLAVAKDSSKIFAVDPSDKITSTASVQAGEYITRPFKIYPKCKNNMVQLSFNADLTAYTSGSYEVQVWSVGANPVRMSTGTSVLTNEKVYSIMTQTIDCLDYEVRLVCTSTGAGKAQSFWTGEIQVSDVMTKAVERPRIFSVGLTQSSIALQAYQKIPFTGKYWIDNEYIAQSDCIADVNVGFSSDGTARGANDICVNCPPQPNGRTYYIFRCTGNVWESANGSFKIVLKKGEKIFVSSSVAWGGFNSGEMVTYCQIEEISSTTEEYIQMQVPLENMTATLYNNANQQPGANNPVRFSFGTGDNLLSDDGYSIILKPNKRYKCKFTYEHNTQYGATSFQKISGDCNIIQKNGWAALDNDNSGNTTQPTAFIDVTTISKCFFKVVPENTVSYNGGLTWLEVEEISTSALMMMRMPKGMRWVVEESNWTQGNNAYDFIKYIKYNDGNFILKRRIEWGFPISLATNHDIKIPSSALAGLNKLSIYGKGGGYANNGNWFSYSAGCAYDVPWLLIINNGKTIGNIITPFIVEWEGRWLPEGQSYGG